MSTASLHAIRRLSSSMTFFYKRVFPACWFGGLLLTGAVLVTSKRAGDGSSLPLVLVPILMTVVGFFVFARFVWPLVDEVWDAGDAVLVRDRDDEELIALADVAEVTWSKWTNPETVTLRLAMPTRCGESVTFMLPHRWAAFGRHPLVGELIERVREAQRKSGE